MDGEFWNWENPIRSLKAILVSLLVGVIGLIPAMISYALVRFTNTNWIISVITWTISALWFIFSFFLWGYLANRWWNWE